MKKIIKFILFFLIIFCLKSVAQKPGDTKVLSDKTTIKGKRELRKEKKVQRREKKLLKKNERKARKKNDAVGGTKREIRLKKRKDKTKAKPVR